MVHIRTLVCCVVQSAQGAVFDKMVFIATLEATFVPDCIYGTIGLGYCLKVSGHPEVQCPDLLFLVFLDGMTKNIFQVHDLVRPEFIFDMRVLHTLNEIRSQNDTGTVSSLDAVHMLCHITEFGNILMHGQLLLFQLGQLVFCYCCTTTV